MIRTGYDLQCLLERKLDAVYANIGSQVDSLIWKAEVHRSNDDYDPVGALVPALRSVPTPA